MASNHGHIGEFSSQLEDWRSYIEHLQNYFIANEVKSELKQCAILLNVCSSCTYKLIHSLLSPQEPRYHKITDHY